MPYTDFRDFLAELERRNLVHRIRTTVSKDTELIPLVRWQFRGLPQSKRKAFLFESVTDARGRRFDGAVAVATLAASPQVYAAAAGCAAPSEIAARWAAALAKPLPPVEVETGPVKEVIWREGDLAASGGVDMFPIPISTPGYDPAPYLTSPYWISRDPDDGSYNVGTYRSMIKAPDRLGISLDTPTQHMALHLAKARRRGEPLPAVAVLGAIPALGLASAAKPPYGVDELALAGGLNGAPLEVVRCETCDLLVPAAAEIVIEGEVESAELELEAPFGEASGFMGPRTHQYYFRVKCITHRRQPIYQAFISQMPPSESSMLRGYANESTYLNFLKNHCNIPSVKRVAFPEMASVQQMAVIQMDHPRPGQAWQALNAAVAFDASQLKVIVAVDEDVDPDDLECVVWALAYRMQPHQDVRITHGKMPRLDPSAMPPGADPAAFDSRTGTSALLINATRPWDYPPTSLPARQHMERARELWEREGLPPLQVKTPWHGYELGNWSEEARQEAALAELGRYLETGVKLAERRRRVEPPR